MPLIKPEVQRILRDAGLESTSKNKGTVDESLLEAGLSNEALADELTSLALSSNNESLRLRALETALKVRGALKEQAPALPSFTIVIQNSSPDLTKSGGVNPILFPRSSFGLSGKEEKEN